LALFGRRPVEPAERLVVAGVQKPAQHWTFRCQPFSRMVGGRPVKV
jgi:hypothetical protein